MVYHGPSNGCDGCRKTKKRCGNERPACARCVRLNRICTGYSETREFEICDESRATALRVTRSNDAPLSRRSINARNKSASSMVSSWLPGEGFEAESGDVVLPMSIYPHADEIATSYFLKRFMSDTNSHWSFIHNYIVKHAHSSSLHIAIGACGMAALENINNPVIGRFRSRSMYSNALSSLNSMLDDAEQGVTHESLLAVLIMAFYETLLCDSVRPSSSWTAHINGAVLLLQLRGKEQLQTPLGRYLFRELRSQILVNCTCNNQVPPKLLFEWQDELLHQSEEIQITIPLDSVTIICYDYAVLRAQIHSSTIANCDALEECLRIETRLIDWSDHARSSGDISSYSKVKVSDSTYVWNGTVYSYNTSYALGAWQTYRCYRLRVMKSQELLFSRLNLPATEHEIRKRDVGRQVVDDICASIPSALGWTTPKSQLVLDTLSAYSVLWPLFYAGLYIVDFMKLDTLGDLQGWSVQNLQSQLTWILGRLEYISERFGIRWARGVIATIRNYACQGLDLFSEFSQEQLEQVMI